MNPIGPRTRIRAYPDHLQSMVRDDAVVLRLGQGDYYALNPIGVRVWALLQVERSLAEIVDVITAEYDVAADVAEIDLVALIENLDKFHLVELRDGP